MINKIKRYYISWNYGKLNGEYLHLVRFDNGQGILLTLSQLREGRYI